jgi:hypothetical protein
MTLLDVSASARHDQTPGKTLADLAMLVVGSATVLIALILWFDNAQGGLTGNGVFKSLELKPWVVDPANAPLYPSNYLFYPVYGALCRLLDLLGVFAGDPRRQLTILNALSASFSAGTAYLLARAITGDRIIAWLTGAFHLATSHVMFLAIVNEDIMPSYTVMFAAMALGAVWFARPTAARVAAVSVLFSIGWLFEWRLMFPTLPAMLAALWFCEPRLGRRFVWIALYLACLVAHVRPRGAGMVGSCRRRRPLRSHLDRQGGALGVGGASPGPRSATSGTASWPTCWGPASPRSIACPAGTSGAFATTFWLLGIAAVAGSILRRAKDRPARAPAGGVRRHLPCRRDLQPLLPAAGPRRCRSTSWPGSPPAWALVLLAARRRWPARGLAAMAAVTVALFAYNVWSIAPLRGLDSKWRSAIERLERQGDPSRTVFPAARFRLDDGLCLAALGHGGARCRRAGAGPAGAAEVQVDRFHRRRAAPSRLEH